MTHAMLETFTIHTDGDIGQEIRDPDGRIIAWTTDSWSAQVIERLLNENDHLLFIKKETDQC